MTSPEDLRALGIVGAVWMQGRLTGEWLTRTLREMASRLLVDEGRTWGELEWWVVPNGRDERILYARQVR